MRALVLLVLLACAHAPVPRVEPRRCTGADPADAKDCRRSVSFGLAPATGSASVHGK